MSFITSVGGVGDGKRILRIKGIMVLFSVTADVSN